MHTSNQRYAVALPPDLELIVGDGNEIINARNGTVIPRNAVYIGIKRIQAVIPADAQQNKSIPWMQIGVAGLAFHYLGWGGLIVWGFLLITMRNSMHTARSRASSAPSSPVGAASSATRPASDRT